MAAELRPAAAEVLGGALAGRPALAGATLPAVSLALPAAAVAPSFAAAPGESQSQRAVIDAAALHMRIPVRPSSHAQAWYVCGTQLLLSDVSTGRAQAA
ncbi:MAG TPA: hypothetical protein VFN67_38460 [Polyangiales bacterium]|jgi:hypothetical protein|nr:hypothetical protein [Polyangiales bacterium]